MVSIAKPVTTMMIALTESKTVSDMSRKEEFLQEWLFLANVRKYFLIPIWIFCAFVLILPLVFIFINNDTWSHRSIDYRISYITAFIIGNIIVHVVFYNKCKSERMKYASMIVTMKPDVTISVFEKLLEKNDIEYKIVRNNDCLQFVKAFPKEWRMPYVIVIQEDAKSLVFREFIIKKYRQKPKRIYTEVYIGPLTQSMGDFVEKLDKPIDDIYKMFAKSI